MHATRFYSGTPLSTRTRRRRRLFQEAMKILDSWSYSEVEVPLLAPYADLRSALGEDRSSDLFRFTGRDGELLVLRGDVTPLISWQYANHLQGRALPVRLSYSKRLARVQREFARERMESYQLGVELIGASGLRADLEVLVVLFDLFDSIGLNSAELRIGHIGITRGVVTAATEDLEARELLLDAIERKDRFEVDQLCLDYDVSDKSCSSMRRLCAVAPDFFDLNYLGDRHDGPVKESAEHLLQLFDALEALGYHDRVQLDLSRRDHRGYYSGVIFSVVSELADSPLGGGGRYDDLIGHFGPELPAIGFGLNADRLVDLLEEIENDTAEQSEVASYSGTAIEAVRSALETRRSGKKVRVESHDTNR